MLEWCFGWNWARTGSRIHNSHNADVICACNFDTKAMNTTTLPRNLENSSKMNLGSGVWGWGIDYVWSVYLVATWIWHYNGNGTPELGSLLGKGESWNYNRIREGSMRRYDQILWFLNQNSYPFHVYDSPLSFRQCYELVNRIRFQLQPCSGYFFHSARTVQSAICGTIPVVLLHKSYFISILSMLH